MLDILQKFWRPSRREDILKRKKVPHEILLKDKVLYYSPKKDSVGRSQLHHMEGVNIIILEYESPNNPKKVCNGKSKTKLERKLDMLVIR